MESQYTSPGVMQFLRTEWQQREQTRIEWELERAESSSRISRLESKNSDLRRDSNSSQRHLEILVGQHKRRDSRESAENGSRHSEEGPSDESSSGYNEIESVQAVSDDLLSTVKDSKSYLQQCVADIRHILRQSGSLQSDSDAMVTLRFGHDSQNVVTSANFGSCASTVASSPNNCVAAGTVTGELLIWNNIDIQRSEVPRPTTIASFDGPVNCVIYSCNSDRLLVAVGNEIRVYDMNEIPRLVTKETVTAETGAHMTRMDEIGGVDDNASIVHLVTAPTGNLFASVSSDGRVLVWSSQDGKDSKLMCVPAHNILACAFALIDRDIHLVLARGPDNNIPESAEGSSTSVDPITGEALKKIIFLFTSGISAMSVTEDSIILGTDNGDIRVIGLARGETVAEITSAHRSEITSFNTQTDASGREILISTSIDGRVSIWSLPTSLWKGRLYSHDSAYGALCSSSAYGRNVISGGDGLIRVYSQIQ